MLVQTHSVAYGIGGRPGLWGVGMGVRAGGVAESTSDLGETLKIQFLWPQVST